MTADRHLLFGLLALQTGLIQQAELVAAFHRWTCDRSRTLADCLVALGHLNAAQRAAVEALAAVHVEAYGGDAERSLAAVPAGKAARDALVGLGDPDIDGTLERVGSAHPQSSADEDDPDRTASVSVGSATSDGQRFRVLRPHARGGLGAVFVAFDSELHREVALKQIDEKHADEPFCRERFIAEAEITGGLEHPGVVPVYGLGADARGRPYYAMRFIKGDSLKATVVQFHTDQSLKHDPGRRSLELRKLLRRFTDACNAADYAHSRGVIHRDLKPANIIVGKYGETLVVDWGLAKSVGRADRSIGEETIAPSASGSSETQPGRALGTPAYMSPEQARGELDRLGPRSDVYSLGATLYCLLTGRPPFAADDIGSVLHAVEQGQFPRPSQLDLALDPALEAICLKAMAVVPEDRYPTPRALADDLDRWMADEPVSAWREPYSRRARRWARRNRTAMTAVAAALLAGVFGLLAVLVVQTQAQAELAAANGELSRSRAAVQARYELAVDAIDTFHTGVSEDFLLKEEKFQALRNRLLKSAADFYSKLSALLGKETGFSSRRALTAANFELAELTAKVGRLDDALAAHRSVLAAREALVAEPAADAELKVDVARSLFALSSVLEMAGKNDEALAACRRSESLLTGLPAASPSSRAALAFCRARLGTLLYNGDRFAEALAAFQQVLADQGASADSPGATDEARVNLAAASNGIGVLLWKTGKLPEAEAELRRALAIRQRLADDRPAVPAHRGHLADTHLRLAILLTDEGRPSEAEAEFLAALAIRRELADENPAVLDLRERLALVHVNVGGLRLKTNKPREAETEFREALRLLRALAGENPANATFRDELARCHSNFASALSAMGRTAAAEAELRAALAIRRERAAASPAVPALRARAAISHHDLANLLSDAGRLEEAEAEFRAVIGYWQDLEREGYESDRARATLAVCHYMVATLRERAGDRDGAIEAHRAAASLDGDNVGFAILALGRLLSEASRHDEAIATFRRVIANGAGDPRGPAGLAAALVGAGRPTEAVAAGREAIGVLDRRVATEPEKIEHRDDLAAVWITVGDGYRAEAGPAAARDAYDRAVAIEEALVRDHAADARFQARLAAALRHRALAQRDLHDPAGAADDVRRALGLLDELQSRSGADWYETGCCHAMETRRAGRNGTAVSADEGSSEADTAMAALYKAVAMGFRGGDAFRNESALDPLRNRTDFRLLMMDLAMPAEPFAAKRSRTSGLNPFFP
jgi:serine/threonine protein kinase/tetratricopeptide (TPR) repeat protein